MITGAAGNLGGLLAKDLQHDPMISLNLMIHNKDVDPDLGNDPKINIFRADLARRESLTGALRNIDVVVHFAGVLFKHNPEKFLPVTNIEYFRNLTDVAIENKVKRIILISFPHVEGETFPDSPARGFLDKTSDSTHARTRLEEEKYLFSRTVKYKFEPVSLRVGMVYGKGILMIDAARWLLKRRLLGIWKKPTWIHLVSKDDFLLSVKNAVIKANVHGIYHIGDNGIQTLQEFLDTVSIYWGYSKPWRLPVFLINAAACMCELFSYIFNMKSPLTRDFIKIGMVSYYGDTSRMKKELLGKLTYKNFREALHTF